MQQSDSQVQQLVHQHLCGNPHRLCEPLRPLFAYFAVKDGNRIVFYSSPANPINLPKSWFKRIFNASVK